MGVSTLNKHPKQKGGKNRNMSSMSDYEGVAGVSAAYFVVHAVFVMNQVVVAGILEKEEDGFDRHNCKSPKLQMADRSLGNLLEQALPFLFGLWTQAFFINIKAAEVLGTFIVITRLLYPFWYSLGGGLNVKVFAFTTLWGYLVNQYFTWSILLLAIFGVNIRKECSDTEFPFAIIGLAIGGFVTCFGIATLYTKLNMRVFLDKARLDA